MRIAVTGSSGLIGRALCDALERGGHKVVRVRRGKPSDGRALWDPAARWMRPGALEGVEAVVHLAGAPVAGGRWMRRRKRMLRASRIDATRLLVDHLANLERRPSVLVSASAVGYYGDRGDEVLTEDSARGGGFLADLAADWERESARAEALGVRVVQLRFGHVLSRRGGLLGKTLPLFRLGLGARLGSGDQWWSWATLEDSVTVVVRALVDERFRGPVNVTAGCATNEEFTHALASAVGRRARFAAPAWALRLALGRGLADEALLAGQRVEAARLRALGFRFRHTELREALAAALRD